ncbi:hypothetical protein CSW00_27015 [Pseudomonas asiatica]|nr:hypothetical protein CSW00_27015 [Pseudomonas sp. MR 02]
MPALSRVNPLPQVLCRSQAWRGPCGSGFTREGAGTGLQAFRSTTAPPGYPAPAAPAPAACSPPTRRSQSAGYG